MPPLPPMSPALRRARPSRFVSARPAAHTPRQLRSAGFSGVDFPIAHTSRIVVLTRRGGLRAHTPRRSPAVSPRGSRAVSCPSFQGLSGTPDPLQPLEIVGSSVYRCGMRQSASSRHLPLPPVPDRHAGDMRKCRDRYTSDMRGASSSRGLLSITGIRPTCAGLPASSPICAYLCRPGHCGFPPGTRRNPPSTRGAGGPIPVGDGVYVGAADMPNIAPASTTEGLPGKLRCRYRPRTNAAAVASRRPGTVRT